MNLQVYRRHDTEESEFTLKCKNCQHPFTPKTPWQQFGDRSCHDEFWKNERKAQRDFYNAHKNIVTVQP